MYNNSLFNAFARSFEVRSETDMSMAEYLESCRGDSMRYANAAERLLAAIGEPQMIDTAKDARLGRIFLNRTMRAYPAFAGFYGMEETIERIVGFFRHAAQGLEERKQILYLLGPVAGGKSSLAQRLKSLMEVHPIYVLKAGDELSPVFESPLSLFDPESLGPMIEEKYGIPRRRLHGLMSSWCYKRLEVFGGDISRFRVAKIQPSRLRQIAVAKTEPGDENNQDISSLVGKADIRKLETFAQNDPDAYSYSGGLNRSNQGVLEFVEMFKAPIKMLHPLLTATQEGNYIGTENIGAIPFTGVILAHSNEAEWQSFKANKKNEAFIDRICEGPHMRADPVDKTLRKSGFNVCEIGRTEHGDEQLTDVNLTGRRVHHLKGRPGIVDEHPLAGDMQLPHGRRQTPLPGAVKLTVSRITVTLGVDGAMLLP